MPEELASEAGCRRQLAPQRVERHPLRWHWLGGPARRRRRDGSSRDAGRSRRADPARPRARRPRRAACRAGSCRCRPGSLPEAFAAVTLARLAPCRKLRQAVEDGDEAGIARRRSRRRAEGHSGRECQAPRQVTHAVRFPRRHGRRRRSSQPSRTSAGATIDAPRP